MLCVTRILSILALFGLLALPAAPSNGAAETDPAILAAVNPQSRLSTPVLLLTQKAVFTDAPAAIIDDFPPFLWSGKTAVEDYSRDLKAVLTKYGIRIGASSAISHGTYWRQRIAPGSSCRPRFHFFLAGKLRAFPLTGSSYSRRSMGNDA